MTVADVTCVALLLGTASCSSTRPQAPLPPTPIGAESTVVSQASAQFVIAPPTTSTVRIAWQFPQSLETTNLIFKLYHSTNISVPLRLWTVVTNVTGTNRSVSVARLHQQDYFTLTASNYLGESKPATK